MVDVGVPTATARTEIRAQYGGLLFGITAFLIWCATSPARVATGLLASAMMLAGYGLVRASSYLLEGGGAPILLVLMAAEFTGAALSLWGWRLEVANGRAAEAAR